MDFKVWDARTVGLQYIDSLYHVTSSHGGAHTSTWRHLFIFPVAQEHPAAACQRGYSLVGTEVLENLGSSQPKGQGGVKEELVGPSQAALS